MRDRRRFVGFVGVVVAVVALVVTLALRSCSTEQDPEAIEELAPPTADATAAASRDAGTRPATPRLRAAPPEVGGESAAATTARRSAPQAPPRTDFSDGPAEAGEIVGRVLLLPDRTPLARVVIRWAELADARGADIARTGANGVFRIRPRGVTSPYRRSYVAVLPGHAAREFEVTVAPGVAVDGIEVLFGGGGKIEGTLSTAAGPVARATVRVVTGTHASGYEVGSATTEPDGSFRFDDVPAGTCTVRAGDLLMLEGTAPAIVVSGQTTRVDLGGAASVRGRILDGESPVPGAFVRLMETRAGEVGRIASAQAGRDGSFRIEGIAPGVWCLHVQPIGGASCSVRVRDLTLVPGENRADIVFGSGDLGGEISGVVIDEPNGLPLGMQRARVQVWQLDERAKGVWEPGELVGDAYPDDDGNYRMRGLSARRYRLRGIPMTTTLLGPAEVDVELGWCERRTGVEIALPALVRVEPVPTASVLAGTVLDAEGRPVAQLEVRATSLADARRTIARRTDGTGRFRIEGLDPGTWRVSVQGTGPEAIRADVAEPVLVAGENTLAIRLDHGDLAGEIRGRVFAADDLRPLNGREITVRAVERRDGCPDGWTADAVIADDGTFRIRSLRAGPRLLIAMSNAGGFRPCTIRVEVPAGEHVTGIEVAMERISTGTVVLALRDAGGHPYTDEVVVEYAREGERSERWLAGRFLSGIGRRWIPAGTYTMSARDAAGTLAGSTSVTVAEGATVGAEIVLRAR